MRLSKYYIGVWFKKHMTIIMLLLLVSILYVVYIVSLGNEKNALFNYIKNLIEKEGNVLDDYIRSETDEQIKGIKTTQEEIDKVKSKIEEINNEKPKDESLDEFFDKRLQ